MDSTTVLPPSDLEISFRPLPPLDDGTVFQLRVLVNETSADRVVDISSPTCPEPFEDILDAANSHICAASTVVRGRRLEERLPLAVRECVRRVRNWHAKGCEVRALKAAGRYDLAEQDLRKMAVTFRSGVQFVLTTHADYPKDGGIELLEVRKADGKMDLPALKDYKVRRDQVVAFWWSCSLTCFAVPWKPEPDGDGANRDHHAGARTARSVDCRTTSPTLNYFKTLYPTCSFLIIRGLFE